MSQEVLEGQQWLNDTYGSKSGYCHVEETGLPGSAMSAALVSAMQIELGMNTITGVFGDMTDDACDRNQLAEGAAGNRVKILQYGLLSKGYNPGVANGAYTTAVTRAVREIQEDAGLIGSQISNSIAGMQAKAILGVDEYKLIPGGDETVRAIQQNLNQNYLAYSGLCAADGVYGRSTNEQLIYALQAEEGLPIGIATGYFGETTKYCCPDLGTQSPQYGYNGTAYDDETMGRFVILARYALYCTGIARYTNAARSKYNAGITSTIFDAQIKIALNAFQRDYALVERSMLGLNEWMSLLVSTGNPNRDALACDCATQLSSSERAQSILNEEYSIVGRYLTGSVGGGDSRRDKNLTSEEISTIFDAGLKLFCIYQDDFDWWGDHDDLSDYFTFDRGEDDADNALNAAKNLSIPEGEPIFFAVDYDFMEDEVHTKVVPYFEGIASRMNESGAPYDVGIYSARNTCGIVSAEGLASLSFVSDMSTGYSGNLGFPLPDNWAFDQIKEYTNPAGIPIDKDVTSGKYMGFSRIEGPSFFTISKTSRDHITQDLNGLSVPIVDVSNHLSAKCNGTDNPMTYQFTVSGGALAKRIGLEALANAIKKVSFSVTAHNGASLDITHTGNSTGSVPAVDEPSDINSFTALSLTSLVIKTVLALMASEAKALKYSVQALNKVIEAVDGNRTTSYDSAEHLSRGFQWSSTKDQVIQTMAFDATFPNPESFVELTYRVVCNYPNAEKTLVLENTLELSDPRA